jgi:hypothetical protein
MTDLPEFIDLRQRHLEAFETAYMPFTAELGDDESPATVGAFTLFSKVIRMAVAAGWFKDDIDVGELLPADVKPLSQAIIDKWQEVISLDPN